MLERTLALISHLSMPTRWGYWKHIELLTYNKAVLLGSSTIWVNDGLQRFCHSNAQPAHQQFTTRCPPMFHALSVSTNHVCCSRMSHHTGVETAHEEQQDTLYPNNHARMLCGSSVAPSSLQSEGKCIPHCVTVTLVHDMRILHNTRPQLKHNFNTTQNSEVWLIGACIRAFRLESSMHCLKSHS